MIPNFVEDPEARIAQHQQSHISHSQISRYLLCPEQYRRWYIDHFRPKIPPATLVFGQLIHQAIADLFLKKTDPVVSFDNAWNFLKSVPLAFNERESWERLSVAGRGLLEKFLREELPKIGAVQAVEKVFEIRITSLDLPLVGIIDLVAEVDGRETIIDWKTAGAVYGPHEVALSDQLTVYKLAEPSVESLALCVLVKTKVPKIEWHKTKRTSIELTDYLAKAAYVARDIESARFYKRPGMHCAWCDFLPLCLGNREEAARTLVRIR